MLAVMAQLQSDQLSEKMRDTRLAEARQGRHVGPIPIGFDRQNGVLVANDYAAAPQLAFTLYATRHHSYVTVADRLNGAGFRTPSGGLFTKFQVEEMLKNPVYIGRVRCKGHEFPGAHEPLIEQEVWDAVQTEIGRRAAHANHDPRATSRPALLSGLVYCSNCGARMWYTPGRGGTTNYDYYVCSGRSTHARDPRCNLPFVQARAAEAHVLASLAVLTLDQDLLAQAADEVRRLSVAERAQPPVDRAAIEAKLKRLARLYEDGLKTEAEYVRERDALRGQLAVETAPNIRPKSSSAVALLTNVPQLLGRATLDERRALLEEVVDVIYLTPHQAMAVRPAESYAPLLRAARLKIMGWWAGWAYPHRTRTRVAS
jgi:site-specific DNA recombinase